MERSTQLSGIRIVRIDGSHTLHPHHNVRYRKISPTSATFHLNILFSHGYVPETQMIVNRKNSTHKRGASK